MVDETWRAIGERLRESRLARGIGQQALGDAMRLDRTAVVKLESGQRRMSAVELVAASDALRVPMSWLAGGPASAMVSRRRPVSEAVADAATFDMDLALHDGWEQTQLLADDGHLSAVPLPPVLTMATERDAVDAAAEVRRYVGLTADEPLGGMADLAAALGLHVQVVDTAVDGASMTPRRGLGVAVLGGQAAPARRRFTCAHEIGHHVLGDEYTPAGSVGDSRDDRERRIDAFATALLLPPTVRTARSRDRMIELSGRYRVSWSLAVRSCGHPEVGSTPTRAEFISAGIEIPEDLRTGYRSGAWRRAVLAARNSHDLTDEAALALMGRPVLTIDDLPSLEEPAW